MWQALPFVVVVMYSAFEGWGLLQWDTDGQGQGGTCLLKGVTLSCFRISVCSIWHETWPCFPYACQGSCSWGSCLGDRHARLATSWCQGGNVAMTIDGWWRGTGEKKACTIPLRVYSNCCGEVVHVGRAISNWVWWDRWLWLWHRVQAVKRNTTGLSANSRMQHHSLIGCLKLAHHFWIEV